MYHNVDHLINVQQLETLWVIGPRESASAPRQGRQRPCPKNSTSCNCGISTVSHNSVRTCWTCTTGTSATVFSTWGRKWSDEQSGPWELPLRHDGEMNLFDLHNRDFDNRVQQLGNVYGPTNSLDHEKLPLRQERDVDDLNGLQLRRPHSFSSLDHGHHVVTVLLVHAGQDAEHPGLARREYNARCNITSETNDAHATAMVDDEMPRISGQTTTEGNTARRGTSPGKPAKRECHCRCRRRARPQEEREEAFGSFFCFLFFLFLGDEEDQGWESSRKYSPVSRANISCISFSFPGCSQGSMKKVQTHKKWARLGLAPGCYVCCGCF